MNCQLKMKVNLNKLRINEINLKSVDLNFFVVFLTIKTNHVDSD